MPYGHFEMLTFTLRMVTLMTAGCGTKTPNMPTLCASESFNLAFQVSHIMSSASEAMKSCAISPLICDTTITQHRWVKSEDVDPETLTRLKTNNFTIGEDHIVPTVFEGKRFNAEQYEIDVKKMQKALEKNDPDIEIPVPSTDKNEDKEFTKSLQRQHFERNPKLDYVDLVIQEKKKPFSVGGQNAGGRRLDNYIKWRQKYIEAMESDVADDSVRFATWSDGKVHMNLKNSSQSFPRQMKECLELYGAKKSTRDHALRWPITPGVPMKD